MDVKKELVAIHPTVRTIGTTRLQGVMIASSLISSEINVARRRKFSPPAIKEHMLPGNRRRRLPCRRGLAVGVPFHAILLLDGSEWRWSLAVIDDPVHDVRPLR